jgi:hypothetical protein
VVIARRTVHFLGAAVKAEQTRGSRAWRRCGGDRVGGGVDSTASKRAWEILAA